MYEAKFCDTKCGSPNDCSAKDCLCGSFCVPCAYGVGLQRKEKGTDHKPSYCSLQCCLIACASGLVSPLFVIPIAGAWTRNDNSDWVDPGCTMVIVQEVCNVCYCSTCRMAAYANETNPSCCPQTSPAASQAMFIHM